MRHRCKVGIQKYYIGNILGSITALCHGNTAIRFFQCQNIINTVTSHGNGMTLCLQCLHHLFLLLRRYTPENTVLGNCLIKLFLCFQCGSIHKLVCVLKSCPSGYGSDCHRVITGNYFQINFLAVKEFQSIRCFLTDHICKKKQTQRFQSFRKFCTFCLLRTYRQNKDTKSFFCILLTACCQFAVLFRKKELCRPHKAGSCLFKYSATVFTV